MEPDVLFRVLRRKVLRFLFPTKIFFVIKKTKSVSGSESGLDPDSTKPGLNYEKKKKSGILNLECKSSRCCTFLLAGLGLKR
jgi:hypothetical protein